MKSNTRTETVKVRLTKDEKKAIEKRTSLHGTNTSDYIRQCLFRKDMKTSDRASFTVIAQEFVNYIETQYSENDEVIGRMVKELWSILS
jgi:uncharacterized protein (DUF1778 family)